MSQWRPGQKEAVLEAARKRGMIPDLPPPAAQEGARIVESEKAGRDSGKGKPGGLAKPRGRAPMNKTETAFARILEARQRREEIVSFDREGITLRWPDGMMYTGDFSVVTSLAPMGCTTDTEGAAQRITIIEVKGAFLREDALVKFRAARANWPLYRFEMWQLAGGEWAQIL